MDLAAAITMLEAHGFRLDVISPADDPRSAHLSGHDLHIELRRTQTSEPLADDSDQLTVVDGGAWGVVPWLDLDDGYGVYLVVEDMSSTGQLLKNSIEELVHDAVTGAAA